MKVILFNFYHKNESQLYNYYFRTFIDKKGCKPGDANNLYLFFYKN